MSTEPSDILRQLDHARGCVAALEHLGCRVLGVICGNWRERPRVHIAEPGDLLAHLDGQYLDTGGAVYFEAGVVTDGCEVVWLIEKHAPARAVETSEVAP